MRRHTSFQREALQQLFAKAMNGLHLHAAGGFDGSGEQAAGSVEGIPVGRGAGEPDEGGFQLILRQGDPGGEGGEKPVGHLSGGGLSVCQAEDAEGLAAGEQQAQYAVNEHMGFAGAGIGGDEGGGCRVGGVALQAGGLRQDVADGWHGGALILLLHQLASSSSSLPHSSMRARWA